MSDSGDKDAVPETPSEATEVPKQDAIDANNPPPAPESSEELPKTDNKDNDGDDPLVIDEAENEAEEKEFEPTIDMMMNDFDDERTMEEEEALDEDQDDDEVSALEQEGDMPLEELLKLYNYGGEEKAKEPEKVVKESEEPKEEQPASSQQAEKRQREEEDVDEKKTAKDPSSSDEAPPAKKGRSELAKFYESAVEGTRALRSSAGCGGVGGPEPVEDEESENGEESDEGGRDLSWKKTIMIGPSYQASVPNGLSYYGDTLPYENEDKLLWNPHSLSEKDAESFLAKSQESLQTGNQGISSLPLGSHVRDDEQALFLLQQCGYNSEEALRRRRMSAVPPAETMSLWSEEECRAFELGLRLYGKDFHMIQQQKVRTRSVGELVQFYYLWKKTERHDVFATATRLEKKKCALHPGTTDYMDRFIDEQDRDIGGLDWTSSTYNSLLFDTRKGMAMKNSENGDGTSPSSSADPSILATGNGSSVQPVPSSASATSAAVATTPAAAAAAPAASSSLSEEAPSTQT